MTDKSYKWDAELYQKHSGFQYELGLMAIERLKPEDGEKILEIGSGNTMLTIEIAKKIPNGHITAIELSEDQCQQAYKNIEKAHISNIEVICMNAIDINYNDEYDAVFSNSAIHWIRNLELMYQLIYNSLKKDGRIMIQTGIKSLNVATEVLMKLTVDYREFLKDFKPPWRFLSSVKNRRILRDIGFKDINVESYEYILNYIDEEELINYWRAAGLVPFMTFIPDDHKKQFVEDFKKAFIAGNQPNPLEYKMLRGFISAKKI